MSPLPTKGDLYRSLKSLTMRSLPTTTDEETSSALFAAFLVSPHSSELVGRLQMAHDFTHDPVLVDTVVELAGTAPAGAVVDATVGGGGHAAALLGANPARRLLGVDRDPTARDAAAAALAPFGDRARVVAGTLGELDQVVADAQPFVGEVAVVLADLGVSSPQLDDPSRGFSFRADAPLDMRMDPTTGVTAAELLATMSELDLTRLLARHGETRFARAIARSVIAAHPTTTLELSSAVERAVPAAARRRGHVATRVFQALRVAVNDEEGELARGLRAAFELLVPGGVVVVISYHSGEDRAVKEYFASLASGGCTCPPGFACVCGAVPRARLLKASATLASPTEVAANPRARSARLRAAWRLP